MGKRNKTRSNSAIATKTALAVQAAPAAPAGLTAHPPAKNPTLLAVSIALFALWFVFLLITALAG
jgi:hypothetical protein